GHPALADAIGIGVVASVLSVVVVEYLALSRLGHALTRQSLGRVSRVLAGVLLVGATVTLVNPERAYDTLLKPSLVALWLSQLVVFAVYPWYAARHGGLRARHVALAAAASALMLFGLWSTTINQIASWPAADGLRLEAVPRASLGEQVPRVRRVALELAAQLR